MDLAENLAKISSDCSSHSAAFDCNKANAVSGVLSPSWLSVKRKQFVSNN